MQRQRAEIQWSGKESPGTHASKFILIGSMNPEEGNLRPQLLDRFVMVVDVTAEEDVDKRIQIVKNRLAYEQDASVFCKRFEERQAHLRTKIDKPEHFCQR